MTPLTRKENYLNEIVGWGETAPEKPLIPEEFFFAAILGEAVQTPEPLSRYQIYLAKIAGRNISVPKPLTRLELFLAKACGMDIETPTPITREEIFWSNYTVIVDFEVEGVPPLAYKAIEGTLENYRIYGNTVGGESVGDRTGNLFDENGIVTDIYITAVGDTNTGSNGDRFIWNRINVLPNNEYIFSWGKKVLGTDNNTPYIRVAQYDSNGNFLSRVLIAANEKPNNRYVWAVGNDVSLVDIRIDDASSKRGQHFEELMFNAGSTPLPYEPFGYKVPVTVSNGTDTLTTPIYLPEQIRKVGDEAEYIDYGEQKMHRIGADDINVTLPALPMLPGTNVLSVGTAVQPSKVYVKYKGERQ